MELLASISKIIENSLLQSLKGSPYYSLMADESTDVCARWLHNNRPVEHFLGIIPVKETNAQALTKYLCDFLESRGIEFAKMRGLGFNGASTMSGKKSGVQNV